MSIVSIEYTNTIHAEIQAMNVLHSVIGLERLITKDWGAVQSAYDILSEASAMLNDMMIALKGRVVA